ncbi:unnamed protein product [Sphagnum jensenii]|uniref:Uncharacterized protein n=1 Tax=Sphagnum jensenii TaxID=128206 RepID=A0ABP0XC09_9BRYO
MVFGRLWGCGGGGPTSGGSCHKILIIPRDLFVCSSHLLLHHHHHHLLLLHSSSRENFPASHGRLAISRKSLRGQRLVEASDNPIQGNPIPPLISSSNDPPSSAHSARSQKHRIVQG